MARLPYQVLVILYLKEEANVKFCVFERVRPKSQIQFVSGGGENSETPQEAAQRELLEETGVINACFQQLTSVCYIPTDIFSEAQRIEWGSDVYVIPEYAFGAEVASSEIQLSDEHVRYKWLSYLEARQTLTWDSNKTALYELNCRLK